MSIEALYEIKRQSFLIGFVSNPERFDSALAYAYENRMSPVFHEGIMREAYGQDPFENAYCIKSDFVNGVLKYIDECWLKKDFDKLQFNKIENMFGGYKTNRMEIIHVIEYARISRRFDEETYKAIEADAPIEASPIASTFSVADVYFG